MENFNAIGAWRSYEAGAAIDASGRLADGTAVNGAVELREAILRQPELFARTFAEKLLTYALGRGLQHYDLPVVRGIIRDTATGNYRFTPIVLGIVRSVPFQMRAKAEP
jgi:hypothetical protein